MRMHIIKSAANTVILVSAGMIAANNPGWWSAHTLSFVLLCGIAGAIYPTPGAQL